MITQISFHKLRIDEYFTYGSRFISIVKKYIMDQAALKKQVRQLENVLNILDEGIIKSTLKTHTQKVKDKDTLRDDTYLALRGYIEACAKRPHEQWQEAANLLIITIKRYGWNLHRENYAIESSRLVNLLGDLQEKIDLKEAVKTIHAEPWIKDLKQTQEEFEAAENERVDARSEKVKINTSEVCKEIKTTIEKIVKFIEVMSEINEEAEFEPVIKDINSLNEEFNNNLKRRGKRNKDTNEPEGETE